ncbi:MAG: hypothetical protein OEM89_00710 [Nitrosopumilus sp.]|nr:hypothetical protein [Nitrosopumilus sp.]
MSVATFKEIESLEKASMELLEMDNIRHVAVINKLGRIVAGRFKPGINRYLDDEKVRMVYMQMMLDLRMRQELDETLGPIDYIISKRKKITIISVPTEHYLVMVSAERGIDSDKVVKRAEELFDIIDLR